MPARKVDPRSWDPTRPDADPRWDPIDQIIAGLRGLDDEPEAGESSEEPEYEEPESYAYLLVCHTNGFIKLGRSIDTKTRFDQICTGSPVDTIELVASWPEAWLSEIEMHWHFAEERQHGEWFLGPAVNQFSEDIRDLMEEM